MNLKTNKLIYKKGSKKLKYKKERKKEKKNPKTVNERIFNFSVRPSGGGNSFGQYRL
jgi:hypothetical protein